MSLMLINEFLLIIQFYQIILFSLLNESPQEADKFIISYVACISTWKLEYKKKKLVYATVEAIYSLSWWQQLISKNSIEIRSFDL